MAVGLVNLVSAVTPDLGGRQRLLLELVPFSVSPALHAVAVPASLGLVAVGGYLWRRRARAFHVAFVLLLLVGTADLLKGLDVEEAAISWSLAAFLVAHRRAFTVGSVPLLTPSRAWRLPALALLPVAALLGGAWLTGRSDWADGHLLLRGIVVGGIPDWGPLVTADLVFWATAAGALAHWLFRAPVPRRRDEEARAAAAAALRAHGRDTLAAFKLRTDLDYFFGAGGRAFAGYRAQGGVLLVSGDPVAPAEELPGLLRDLRAFARRHDLRFGAVGASCELAERYRAEGLNAFYIGDEAIVETAAFSLEGRAIRKVRQSVHRLERAGYTAECLAAGELDARTKAGLERISRSWLNGIPERGFSMALDGIGSEDTVVVVARDATGEPRGFLHFVPSYGRPAMSLSAMRRERGTPNGLTEFLVTRAIDDLRDRGVEEVSLNFSDVGPAAPRARDRARAAAPAAPLGRRPALPDREPPPLQRQVRAALGAPLPDLRGGACVPPGRDRDAASGGPAAAAPPGPCRRLSAEADARTRTGDPFITSEVLYQLSYVGSGRIVPRLTRAR